VDRADRPADKAQLAVGLALLLVLGAAIGVWGAFLVPLRLPGGLEGLADILGFAGPLAAGYFGAVGLGVGAAAVFPGIGWILSILMLGYSPGGDVVIPGKLGTDPGIGTVGGLYLISGLLGTLAAGVLASMHLRRVAARTGEGRS
jgi:hypothetical protein